MDLKDALRYLVSLNGANTFDLNGSYYADRELYRIEEPKYKKKNIEFGSLDAIVKMVQTELEDYLNAEGAPLFIQVKDYLTVEVFSRADDREARSWPYTAKCRDASFSEGYRSQQKAIIELRSRFIPTDDSEYLLKLISRINNEQGVQSEDNGVSQKVVTKQGVTLMTSEAVKPRLTLQPFRTFREVPQPESEFILRLNDDGDIGLFEADGGIWKLEAKDNIKAYFDKALAREIAAGLVVVMV